MNLFTCQCGSRYFKREKDIISCAKCSRTIDDIGKVGFFDISESRFQKSIIKLGIDIGIESVVWGTSTLIGVVAPWILPFSFTALGMTLNSLGESIFEFWDDSFLSDDSFQKKIGVIFEQELRAIIKKGIDAQKRIDKNNSDDDSVCYVSFYRYQQNCAFNYSRVIGYLLNKGVNTDIFSEEAIRMIISDDFGYPGREDGSVLQNVLDATSELRAEFEKKILNNKETGLRWLLEKKLAEQKQMILEVKKSIECSCTDYEIDDTTYEYIKNYGRPLFLEKNNNITLGKMYLDPAIKESTKCVMDVIKSWFASELKLMFVYGASGVGKTSLVTKLVADVYGISLDDGLGINKKDIHPIILREHIRKIEDETNKGPYSSLGIIKEIIEVPYQKLEGGLIILDGFDELCVLAEEFDKKEFVENLIEELDSYNIKVLIMSRPMNDLLEDFQHLPRIELEWKEKQICSWCDKFSDNTKFDEERQWCIDFKNNYRNIFDKSDKDERLEMFSVPLILYLACKSNTTISADDSIGKFYHNVFSTISQREHSKNQRTNGVYRKAEREQLLKNMNWQFTKELAYQMCLNETLSLTNSDENNINRIEYAKKRTLDVLRLKGQEVTDTEEIDTSLYLAVFHFAIGKGESIEFAHRTVSDYFTALKLYEDYFAMFDYEYFKNNSIEQAVVPVWQNIIEAFRYAQIPSYLFNYLTDMAVSQKSEFDKENFLECYILGMEQGILSDLEVSKPIKEYKVSPALLNIQISRAFRNLTWFLTGLGYNNQDNNRNGVIIFRELLSSFISNVNLSKWKLENSFLKNTSFYKAYLNGTDFEEAFLRNSDFEGAALSDAILKNAVLSNANLKNAVLENAVLSGADLRGADMEGAKLSNASLYRAHLSRAKLIESNLENANLIECDLKDSDLSIANMSKVDLRNAFLNNANLRKTNLSFADLSGADLSNTDLNKTNLDYAKYCLDKKCETVFPNGFDPSKRNMIEVDINGIPIKI